MTHSEVGVHINGEPQPAVQAPWMTDRLISISDIRTLFGLRRTAAYELTHRPDFPEPVVISPRCYRWWASEVTTFAIGIRHEGTRRGHHGNTSRAKDRQVTHSTTPACRISGKVRVARTRMQTP
jgi:predicted DNA-binding transcriptional regulator AlpA